MDPASRPAARRFGIAAVLLGGILLGSSGCGSVTAKKTDGGGAGGAHTDASTKMDVAADLRAHDALENHDASPAKDMRTAGGSGGAGGGGHAGGSGGAGGGSGGAGGGSGGARAVATAARAVAAAARAVAALARAVAANARRTQIACCIRAPAAGAAASVSPPATQHRPRSSVCSPA